MEQIVSLVLRMPSERKREVLLALEVDSQVGRELRLHFAEVQFCRLSAARDLSWDAMTEDERETFADDLVHEN